MKTIAILSQKGGAGKTTLAINLSVAAISAKKQAAIIDLDPQASSANWHDARDQETPVVVSAQPTRLNQVLEAANEAGASFVFMRTRFGRSIFSVGGNETASVFSGINAPRIVFLAYVISGFATACAAIIMGSRVMGAQSTIGQGYELNVLAGIILGGTSLLGGSGSIWRTIIGVAMLGFIQNGLLLMGFPYYVQWLVTWFVIILAVWIDLAAKRGRIFA